MDPEEDGLNRRDALIALVSAVATPALLYGATDSEREEAREEGVPAAGARRSSAETVAPPRGIPIIEKNVTASYETLISLAIRDAGSFDAVTGTGGLNGSVRFELDGPENKRWRRRRECGRSWKRRREIDAKADAPVGWADLIALAPFATARYQFLRDYCGVTLATTPRWQYKAGDINGGGATWRTCSRRPTGTAPSRSKPHRGSASPSPGSAWLTGQRVHMGRADVRRGLYVLPPSRRVRPGIQGVVQTHGSVSSPRLVRGSKGRRARRLSRRPRVRDLLFARDRQQVVFCRGTSEKC